MKVMKRGLLYIMALLLSWVLACLIVAAIPPMNVWCSHTGRACHHGECAEYYSQ